MSLKAAMSLDFDHGLEGRVERAGPQMTVEEEIRQAANKTKEVGRTYLRLMLATIWML